MKLLNFLFLPKTKTEPVDGESFFKRLQANEWKDKFLFGISSKKGNYYSADFRTQPGAAYIGGSGGGKTTSIRFTSFVWQANNSENSLMLIFDAFKGATDLVSLFKYPNIIPNLMQVEKFMSSIDMIWDESTARKEEFFRVGAKDYIDYEKITGERLARIVIVVEEFHGFNDSKALSLNEKADDEGTTAYQFTKLMRIGRSQGIFLMLATQRAGYSDIPSNIKPAITNWLVHKVNSPGDAQAANVLDAENIPSGARGRCIHNEEGLMQFPFIDKNINTYLDKHVKPFSAKLLTHQFAAYTAASQADGNKGMVLVKPIVFLIQQNQQFKMVDIAERILLNFGFTMVPQENTSLIASFIATKNGLKYAVILSRDGEKKQPKSLEESWSLLGCDRIVSMNFDGDDSFSTLVEKFGGFSLGDDELIRIGQVLDNKKSFTKSEEYMELLTKTKIHDSKEAVPEKAEASSEDPSEPKETESTEPTSSLRDRFKSRMRKYTSID